MVSEKINEDKKNNERCKIIKLGCNVIFEISMEYFKTQSYQSSLEHLNEIWSTSWAFLVRICSYSMLVMYLLCICLTWSSSCWLIPIKQNFKHSLKNAVWQFKFLLLSFFYYYYYYYYYYYLYYQYYYYYYYYYYYFLHIKQTLFFTLLDRLIRLELEEGW